MTAVQRPKRLLGSLMVGLLTLAIGSQALAHNRSTALAAALTPVTFVLQGMHPNDVDYHLGTFTAPPPLCSSGTWQGNGHGRRVFTCADGSGTFTASFDGEQEHYTGGHGPWKISEGSGSYVTLRGQGAGSNVLLSSDPITFTDTWQGVVDMDATPPKISLSAASATRVRGSRTSYQVQVAFTARDDVADNPAQYTLAVTDSLGRDVAWHTGTAGPTPVALKLTVKIRPPADAKTVTLELAASDPVGNQQTIHRTIKLPPLPKTRKAGSSRIVKGSAAAAAPKVTVLRRSSGDAPGYVFIAPKGGNPQGPEIVDDRGRPVWFRPTSKGDQAGDFRVQSYRGQPVLTWWQGSGSPSTSRGVDYIVDSSYRLVATVRAGNGLAADGHEFVLTPQGTALITIYNEVPYDLSAVGGPKDGAVVDCVVQEVDVETGRVLFEWHSLGHVPLDESHLPLDTPYDYFHINAVNLDNDGNLLISARHTWTVYKVERHTGEILWRLGGKRSDFKLGPGVQFAWQHNPLPAGENTIRLFDNEYDGNARVLPSSRVIWLHLDTDTMTATLVKAFAHPARISVGSQGNAQALDNGDTFVGWGELGRVSELDPNGKLLFDATLPSGYDTYRAYRANWAGRPETSPSATARTHADGTTTVHAIWNGATGIAAWRILAGSSATALSPVRMVGWSGLDTTVKIAGKPRKVEVVALAAGGSVIGTSLPVSVGKAVR